ncbi:MAG: hypothetical protein QM784_17390 [Polyangiaceae bacterium]
MGRAIVGRADEFDVESGDTVWSTSELPEIVLPTRGGWVLTFESEIRRIEGGKTVYSADGEGAVTEDDLLVSLHEGIVSLVGSEGLRREVELAEKRSGYIWQMNVEPQGRWLAYATQHGVAVVDLHDGSERLWLPGLLQASPSDPVLLGWKGSVVFMRREEDYLLFDARSQTQLVLGLEVHADAPPQFYAISPSGFVDGSPELVAQLSSEGKPLPVSCQHPGLLREWLADVNAP